VDEDVEAQATSNLRGVLFLRYITSYHIITTLTHNVSCRVEVVANLHLHKNGHSQNLALIIIILFVSLLHRRRRYWDGTGSTRIEKRRKSSFYTLGIQMALGKE
jgi:hypothetical protein